MCRLRPLGALGRAGRAPSADPGASGRLQGRCGGAAHLVAEEAREAALGGGAARRRKPPHVPEAQRAVVRGGVEHLAVHLDAVDDEGVAAEHPPQGSRLGVEGARAGVPAACEH